MENTGLTHIVCRLTICRPARREAVLGHWQSTGLSGPFGFEPQVGIIKKQAMPAFIWWRIRGSNPWPHDCQSYALPAALIPHYWSHWPGSNRPPARYECAALPDELQWHAQINILINRMMIFYYVRKVPSIHNFHFLRRFFRNRLTSVCAEDIVLTCLF